MRRRRVCRITVKEGHIQELVNELKAWHVPESHYAVSGDIIITSDTNVIDVATETFINRSALVTFEEVF